MVKLKVQHNFNGLFILYYFFCQSEWRSGDFRSLLNYLEFSLASAHSNTFIPGKIYFSDLKEQGQVLLQFIGTFHRVLVINHILCIWPFILSCGCTFSLCEEDWILPWPVRNWVVFHSSFAVFFFFFLACLHIGSASEQGQFKCLSAASPVLPASVSVAAFTHLSSTSWVSCCLSCPLASASRKVWSGLGLVPSCVCWVVSTTCPACTQTMFYYRIYLWWTDFRNDIL